MLAYTRAENEFSPFPRVFSNGVYRVLSRDVTAAMLLSPINPPGIELDILMQKFSFVLVENMLIDHVSENILFRKQNVKAKRVCCLLQP